MSSEFGFIDWIRRQTPANPSVSIGPGDDCAAVRLRHSDLLITTDMLMDGVDFLVAEVDPRRIGRKALAVNLSDIAAMAGKPTAVVVSVALPRKPSLAEPLYLGMREMADRFDVPIVGGDTNSWEGPLVISVTLFGEPTGSGPVRRSGAKPGDWLFVTGPCGGSLLGHHLDFTPRVHEAQLLHQAVELRSMIDISDGLTADLKHILDESGCGAVLQANAIPIAQSAGERSRSTGQSPLHHALSDGEDFELLLSVSPADGKKLLAEPPVPLWKIGECVPEGLWLEENGSRQELCARGWVHQFERRAE